MSKKLVRLMDPSAMAFQEVLAVLGMGQPIGLTRRGGKVFPSQGMERGNNDDNNGTCQRL